MKHRIDEALSDLRNWWERWTPEQRQAFKKWVDNLDTVRQTMPDFGPNVTLRLEFSEPEGDEESHEFSPPIHAVKKAIEHWERGECYAPTKLGELTG
jgi:hypothetical protein